MAKIRNVYDHPLMIHVRGVWRHVEPDHVVEVPDEDLPAYIERETGGVKEPSDLWVEAADFTPPAPTEDAQ